MSGFRVEGVAGNLVEVDAGGNVQVALPNTEAQMGTVKLFSQNDSGTFSGTPYLKPPETSTDYRLRCGTDTLLFVDYFNATSQNTGIWKHAFTNMTMTQSAGLLNCNANLNAASGSGCSLSTWRSFSLIPQAPLIVECKIKITNDPVANQVFEFGQFVPTTTTAPADGAYFRYTSAGVVGVVNYNGTEIETPVLLANITTAVNHVLTMVVDNREIELWMDGKFLGEKSVPSGNGAPYMSSSHPITVQQRNSGAVTGTQMQVNVAAVLCLLQDPLTSKPWPHQLGGMGLHCSQATNGNTLGSTAFYANNLAAGAGALPSNTTNTNFIGLGGQFGSTYASGLAVNTDGIIQSFLNPAGTVNVTPRTLYITGVWIHSAVTTVLSVATPVVLLYALRYGGNKTNGDLSGAESGSFTNSTAKIPRVVPLGTEQFGINAAVGTLGGAAPIIQYFDSPIVVSPGEYVEISAKNLTTVLTSGVITHLIGFDGYWE
jgi:hypothetical protein